MLKYPEIDPVMISIFGLKIRWYGMMYVAGFLVGWWLARRRAHSPHALLNREQVDDLVFSVMLGVILGGRFGSVFVYNLDTFLGDPLYLVRIWEGGMSFHGGLVGVIVAMWLYGRKIGRGMWQMTDFVAPLVPPGLGFGRIGNFINGELWGKPADVPWGFSVGDDVFPGFAPGDEVLHPSQLYEALLEGLVLFVVLWWFSSKPRPTMAVSGLFLVLYGAFRCFIELYRVPDEQFGYLAFGWVTMGQVLSLPMIVAGMVLLYLAWRPKRTKEATT